MTSKSCYTKLQFANAKNECENAEESLHTQKFIAYDDSMSV